MALLKPRIRKIIGTVFLLVLMILYALISITIASIGLANSPWYAHLAFFASIGILWIIPAMAIIKWMIKP